MTDDLVEIPEPLLQLMAYFGTPERPVTKPEFYEFWNACNPWERMAFLGERWEAEESQMFWPYIWLP